MGWAIAPIKSVRGREGTSVRAAQQWGGFFVLRVEYAGRDADRDSRRFCASRRSPNPNAWPVLHKGPAFLLVQHALQGDNYPPLPNMAAQWIGWPFSCTLGGTVLCPGQQSFSNPLRFVPGSRRNCGLDLAVFLQGKPSLDQDAAQLGLRNLRSAHLRFHSILCV